MFQRTLTLVFALAAVAKDGVAGKWSLGTNGLNRLLGAEVEISKWNPNSKGSQRDFKKNTTRRAATERYRQRSYGQPLNGILVLIWGVYSGLLSCIYQAGAYIKGASNDLLLDRYLGTAIKNGTADLGLTSHSGIELLDACSEGPRICFSFLLDSGHVTSIHAISIYDAFITYQVLTKNKLAYRRKKMQTLLKSTLQVILVIEPTNLSREHESSAYHSPPTIPRHPQNLKASIPPWIPSGPMEQAFYPNKTFTCLILSANH
ncbi:hypothetical protein DSO57_1015926 [Entomophthora muscae]|uniref:Uncharacterized protein n=1 Tax=Entomophthora muscae TaxID=34485 RepID=A0ACC2TSC5_9FUNG|nr:hypothetical protein DSO57_1015926 [Entomophthora muscae]